MLVGVNDTLTWERAIVDPLAVHLLSFRSPLEFGVVAVFPSLHIDGRPCAGGVLLPFMVSLDVIFTRLCIGSLLHFDLSCSYLYVNGIRVESNYVAISAGDFVAIWARTPRTWQRARLTLTEMFLSAGLSDGGRRRVLLIY